MSNFINTLLDIITNSPSSVLFIILGIIFATAMIINIKNKKQIGKLVFILGWLFIVTFILIRFNSYLNKLFDNLINNIFMQIFFPNLATYIIIIIITNIIFLYTILSKKTANQAKITNTIFFITIMVFMVYTLEQIITNNINVYQFTEVYTNSNITTLIQSTTLLFTLWIILIISKLIINKLIQKSIENITNEEQINNIKINKSNSLNSHQTINNIQEQNNIESNKKTDESSDDNNSNDDDIEILTL